MREVIFGDGGPVTAWKEDVGEGWWSLIDQLHEELVQVAPNYQTVQLKEKFGGLRVYLRDEDDSGAVGEIVRRHEELSFRTCEYCGQPGTQTHTAWVKTLCPSCAGNREEIRRAMWDRAARHMGRGGGGGEGSGGYVCPECGATGNGGHGGNCPNG